MSTHHGVEDVDMNTRYISLTEKNEHEGETWRYWLPVAGNETEIEKLADLLHSSQEDMEDPPYVLGDSTVPPDEVFALVKHSLMGYTYFENLCVGRLRMPDFVRNNDPSELLYKGGIKDCFE